MFDVNISSRVTDISQIKLHKQDNEGVCISVHDDEWVWMSNDVAHRLSFLLDVVYSDPTPQEDLAPEEEYQVSYSLPDTDTIFTMKLMAISEADAMVQFYDNCPQEYKALLLSIEATKDF